QIFQAVEKKVANVARAGRAMNRSHQFVDVLNRRFHGSPLVRVERWRRPAQRQAERRRGAHQGGGAVRGVHSPPAFSHARAWMACSIFAFASFRWRCSDSLWTTQPSRISLAKLE